MLAPIKWISPNQLESWRPRLIRFARLHGSRRIAAGSLNWLKAVTPLELERPGTAIAAAFDGRRLCGIACAADYGKTAAFAVVHPDCRGLGIGTSLMSGLIEKLGALECVVACDNVPSISMCFQAGMGAVSLTKGATGRPALRFVAGNFRDDGGPSPQKMPARQAFYYLSR